MPKRCRYGLRKICYFSSYFVRSNEHTNRRRWGQDLMNELELFCGEGGRKDRDPG